MRGLHVRVRVANESYTLLNAGMQQAGDGSVTFRASPRMEAKAGQSLDAKDRDGSRG